LLRRRRKNTINPTIAITATPPTAPPTIAPIGINGDDDAGTGVGVGVGFGEELGAGEGLLVVGDEDWLGEVEVVRTVGGE
jgi:hypothetical protein